MSAKPYLRGAAVGMPRFEWEGDGPPDAADVCMAIESWIANIPAERRPPVYGQVAKAFLALKDRRPGESVVSLWNAMATWCNAECRRAEEMGRVRAADDYAKRRSTIALMKQGRNTKAVRAAEQALEHELMGTDSDLARERARQDFGVSHNSLRQAIFRIKKRKKLSG